MREIKFRAWNKQTGTMASWLELKTQYNWNVFDQVVVHLMQYTGLLDKNGKEIYEGDVLQNDHIYRNDGLKDEPYVVEYLDLHDDIEVGMVGLWVGWIDDLSEIEVIGNIYENPERVE